MMDQNVCVLQHQGCQNRIHLRRYRTSLCKTSHRWYKRFGLQSHLLSDQLVAILQKSSEFHLNMLIFFSNLLNQFVDSLTPICQNDLFVVNSLKGIQSLPYKLIRIFKDIFKIPCPFSQDSEHWWVFGAELFRYAFFFSKGFDWRWYFLS